MWQRSVRRLSQAGFLTLTIVGVFVVGGNAERWCPFGGVEAVYTYAREGNLVCSLGVSNFYILAAVLLSLLIVRRSFCSYVCPLGTISEWTYNLGRRLHLPTWRPGRTAERVLGLLKYVILVVILFFTWRTAELMFRGYDPCYALLSRHGEDITVWAYVISGVLLAASLVISVPLCRWLCPLAAVMNPLSRFGLMRVRRQVTDCSGCRACTLACPMGIRVHQRQVVKDARCTGCLNCVSVCPTAQTGVLAWSLGRRRASGWWPLIVVVGLLGSAVAAAYMFPLPSFVKTRGTAPAETAYVDLAVHDLTCRGRATLFVYYLERDDQYALPGYLRIEAWPGPDPAAARVIYDPGQTDADAIRQAVTEPYYDYDAGVWRSSPFAIEGYDPLAWLQGGGE